MDRRYELEIMLRTTAMVPPGQLALRREAALQMLEELIALLEELIELRGRYDALRAALRQLADDL
jgi:hypothetical protein